MDYKLVLRENHKENTVIEIGKVKIGQDKVLIAGPCTIESEAQMLECAEAVKHAGANILRGGAFKPRTSPYSFQGLGEEALLYLKEAKEKTGLPTISEIVDIKDLPLFENVDILQVGAKNMQNFELLKELGRQEKPVLLKRNFGATIDELLSSAEYIMAEGNKKVILCERGIKSFDHETRFLLDLGAVAVLKLKTHLPVIVDPSHAMGRAELVPSMAKAAMAAGADGVMIEVHNNPECALCDGAQSLKYAEFEKLAKEL